MTSIESRKTKTFVCYATSLAFLFLISAGASTADERAKNDLANRGKYLVTVIGCHDCHTPKKFGPKGPEFDMERELSGHPQSEKLPELPQDVIGPGKWAAITNSHLTAWYGPWGVFEITLQ